LGKTGYRLYLANRGDEQDVRAYKVAFDLGQVSKGVGRGREWEGENTGKAKRERERGKGQEWGYDGRGSNIEE